MIGNILEEREYLDHFQVGFFVVAHRRGREAAIAVHAGRDAVTAHGFEIGHPPQRRNHIVVVRFNEARRDIATRRIDHPLASFYRKVGSHFGDEAVGYANVGLASGCSGSVDDSAAFDENIELHVLASVQLEKAQPAFADLRVAPDRGAADGMRTCSNRIVSDWIVLSRSSATVRDIYRTRFGKWKKLGCTQPTRSSDLTVRLRWHGKHPHPW